MRTVSAAITAAQIAHTLVPSYKIALTYAGGANDVTYDETRILSIDHLEKPYHQAATVVLNNSDGSLTVDYKGFKGIISYGIGGTFSGGATAPLTVMGQHSKSKPGELLVTLVLLGIPDLLAADENSAHFFLESNDIQTLQDLFKQIVIGTTAVWSANTAYTAEDLATAITTTGDTFRVTVGGQAGGVEPTFTNAPDVGDTIVDNEVTWKNVGKNINVFTHTVSYTTTFDSEDPLLDVFIPADAFEIGSAAKPHGETRLGMIKFLLAFTKNVMRAEDDGAVHFLDPVVSGGTYAYEYKLGVTGAHELLRKSTRQRVLMPNRIEVATPPDYDGTAFSGTAEDTDSSDLTDLEKRRHRYVRLVSDAQGTALANAELQELKLNDQLGSALVPMNVGQEVHDFIKITDSRQSDTLIGNIGTLRRLAGRGQWHMEIALGDVIQGGFLGLQDEFLDVRDPEETFEEAVERVLDDIRRNFMVRDDAAQDLQDKVAVLEKQVTVPAVAISDPKHIVVTAAYAVTDQDEIIGVNG